MFSCKLTNHKSAQLGFKCKMQTSFVELSQELRRRHICVWFDTVSVLGLYSDFNFDREHTDFTLPVYNCLAFLAIQSSRRIIFTFIFNNFSKSPHPNFWFCILQCFPFLTCGKLIYAGLCAFPGKVWAVQVYYLHPQPLSDRTSLNICLEHRFKWLHPWLCLKLPNQKIPCSHSLTHHYVQNQLVVLTNLMQNLRCVNGSNKFVRNIWCSAVTLGVTISKIYVFSNKSKPLTPPPRFGILHCAFS